MSNEVPRTYVPPESAPCWLAGMGASRFSTLRIRGGRAVRGGAFHTQCKGAPPGRRRHRVIRGNGGLRFLAQGLQAPHGVAGIRSCAGIFQAGPGRSVRWPVAALGRGCAVTAGAAAGASIIRLPPSAAANGATTEQLIQDAAQRVDINLAVERAVASAGFGRHRGCVRADVRCGSGAPLRRATGDAQVEQLARSPPGTASSAISASHFQA